MGLSREQKKLFNEMSAMIAEMRNPKKNPAQEFLTNEALSAANFLTKGEYGKALPKGSYFDFQGPAARNETYKRLANVNQGGTFALAGNNAGGRTQAQALQGKYLSDRFARDSAQQYQNDIRGAWDNVRQGLGQASNYQTNQQSAIMGALGNMYQMAPQKGPSPWGSILGIAGSALSMI